MLSTMSEAPSLQTGELCARVARALEARPEVLDAYVFGSVARGEAQLHSDIDVAVYLDRRHSTGEASGPRPSSPPSSCERWGRTAWRSPS